MLKKFFTYQVFLIVFLGTIGVIFYGALLRHAYLGGQHFKPMQSAALLVAEIPSNILHMIENRSLDLNKITPLTKHQDKLLKYNKSERFQQFIPSNRDALLVLSRYDHSLSRSVVDVIDLRGFKVIHTYMHDIAKMNSEIKNSGEFPLIERDQSPTRFLYRHPLLLDDGSLISNSNGPEFKIDFCSNLIWINDEDRFHHSSNFDHENRIWQVGELKPYSHHVNKYHIEEFTDVAIFKFNADGEILYRKSVLEILIENHILPTNFAFSAAYDGILNPIHLNDIQPALSDTKYWNRGDLFLSIKNQSAIVQYRPDTNQVIRYLVGPFARQHDVDIISDTEISIFNNNNFMVNNEYSEVLIYNFETEEYSKLFHDTLMEENFKTRDNGLSEILNDGSLLVEEQNHGRILLINNEGQKEWEFVNKDKNGKIGHVKWARIVEDKKKIENFQALVESEKCANSS